MNILIDNSTKLRLAIDLANKRKFYDAICIFAQMDNYESNVNCIVCWCHLVPFSFVAADLYARTKQLYPERSIYSDVSAYWPLTNQLLKVCECGSSVYEGPVKADPSLLINRETVLSEDVVSEQDGAMLDDLSLIDDPRYSPNNIYDVNSEEYFTFLRLSVRRCQLVGDEKKMKEYAKRLWKVKTKHMPTLEAQIEYSLYYGRYKKGLVYAKRAAKCENVSFLALKGAIEIYSYTERTDDEVLSVLLHKISKYTLYDPNDLRDYCYFASEFVHDEQLTYEFALQLFNHCEPTIEVLHVCACAFYNHGDVDRAKNAAYMSFRAAPTDILSVALFRYISENATSEHRLHLDIPPRAVYYVKNQGYWLNAVRLFSVLQFVDDCTHFFVPKPLLDKAKFNLKVMLAKQNRVLEVDRFNDLALVIRHLRMSTCGISADYDETVSLIDEVLSVRPADAEMFVAFAKIQLGIPVTNVFLQSALIFALLRCNCKETIYVALPDTNSCLNLGAVKHEKQFNKAISVCAALVPLEQPSKYHDTYLRMKNVLDLKKYNHYQLAFALLSECEKDFGKQYGHEFFSDEMHALHLDYLFVPAHDVDE